MSETTIAVGEAKAKPTLYAVGICTASGCFPSEWDAHQVERFANEEAPTGINSLWAISNDSHFASGEVNPCPCDRHPAEMKHWLLNC